VYYSDFMGRPERRYGLAPRHSFWEPHPELERLLARDLAESVGGLGGSGPVLFKPTLGVGRTAEHVLALAETERADLIVVGTHHKRGLARLASVSGIALHASHASVACIPETSEDALATGDVASVDCVLVPTDLSPASNAALRHACGLLSSSGGELVLAHVVDRDSDENEADLVATLRALVSASPAVGPVRVRTEVVRHADAATAICELAERAGADVICMASHGRSGVKRAVLGSVAEAVLRQTRRPLLIVKPLPA
jgi:nucleotide-binding universal stress UspA family protein